MSNGQAIIYPTPADEIAVGGDLSGSLPNPTVVAIQGNAVEARTLGASQDGYVLTWNNAGDEWKATAASGGGTVILSGDVTGASNANVVVNIHGSTVPAGGSLTTGNTLGVTGVGALSYSALNLAGGANYVTGALPSANQAVQTMGGDVTGTTAANTVVNLTGSSGVVTIQTGTSAITGSPPVSDIAPANLTITGHAPYASAVTHTSPGNLVLATAAPLSGGTIGTTSIVNDGYTQLNLGYALTDYVSFGPTPALSGYIRLPYPSVTTTNWMTYRNTGNTADLAVLSINTAAGDITLGNSTITQTQLQNSSGYLEVSGNAIFSSNMTSFQPVVAGPFAITPFAQATGTALTINGGKSTNAGTTGGALTLNGAIGTGGASLSAIGGAVNINGGAGVVATSGTVGGAIGGGIVATTGVGAAGFGSNQNGGAGGNWTIDTGAGGAATGAGTAGAAGSIINQVGGTTVLSMGVAGVGLLASASSVPTTGGTTTLSAAQYLTPIIRLSGTLTSAATIAFPNTAGMWFVDVGALVGLSGTNTLTFQSGSATTTAVTSLVTNSNIFMISTYGSNTISINI